MKNRKIIKFILFFSLAILLSVNTFATNEPGVRSILVIPPVNESFNVKASDSFLSIISRPLIEKGYYVFPVSVMENFFRQNGLPTSHDMNNISLDKVREYIGADAILYTKIINWEQSFRVTYSQTKIRAKLTLINAKTGKLIWETIAKGKEKSKKHEDRSTSIAAALLTQAFRSSVKENLGFARKTIRKAIFETGLPDGPLI